MDAWLIGLTALGLALVYGTVARNSKWAQPLITGLTLIFFVEMLFGLLVSMWPDFRRIFSYPVQFYAGLGVRHSVLAMGELAGGWILCEGLRQKRAFYLVVAPLFIVGVAAMYQQRAAHDYAFLETETDAGKVTLQTTGYTCTAASLSNLTALLGKKISERQAAELMHLDSFGGAVWQIGYVLQKLGYSFEEVRGESIGEVKFPALLIVKYSEGVDHAVVVTGRKGDEYTVLDPLSGETQYPADWFQKRWRDQGVTAVHR